MHVCHSELRTNHSELSSAFSENPDHLPKNSNISCPFLDLDRLPTLVVRLQFNFPPPFEKPFHRRFLPDQGYHNISCLCRRLGSNAHIITGEDVGRHAVARHLQEKDISSSCPFRRKRNAPLYMFP